MSQSDPQRPHNDSYSGFQREIGRRTAPLRMHFADPLLRVLVALHVSPNALSLAQIPLGALIVIIISSSRGAVIMLLIGCFVLDGLDGLLARYTQQANAYGALVDQMADQIREVLTIAAVAQVGALSPVVAALYGVLYPVSNVGLYLVNAFGGAVSPVFKSVLTFYPFLLIFLLGGPNWLEWAGWLTVLAMAHTIALCLHRLKHLMIEITTNPHE